MTSRDRENRDKDNNQITAYRSPTAKQVGDSSGGSSVLSSYSGMSVTSTFRHQDFSFTPPTPTVPEPVLTSDTTHKPKTRGSFGMMIVGLGGSNATTMLAGILANRLNIQWRGARGEHMKPNYNGCLTQIDQRGEHGGVGYRDKIGCLADASMAAIGGWDIRPTKLGDALLGAQILDYDLVRQIKDDMNKIKVFRGLYNSNFVDTSLHQTATHILSGDEAKSDGEALKCLRADIRYFKWRNGVVGHTSVVWSASDEIKNCELLKKFNTSRDLLQGIEMSEDKRGGPLPPSLIYATAALLEGCSFIYGGNQDLLSCPGLEQLSKQQLGVYCLGTNFKAGPTQFKTTAVEYLRTMGYTPKVIASSNHTGTNERKSQALAKHGNSPKQSPRRYIFGPWEEKELDYKVSSMYTPFISDDRRDFVEYTSIGFLGTSHTMVTYTQASNSAMCAPLMIDAAVWCDFFAGLSWPCDKVCKALAYLFEVPESGAKGIDPGFFKQMDELNTQATAARDSKLLKRGDSTRKRRVRIRPEEKATEWAIPHDARIICAGLACVDMQLNHATGGGVGVSIETFQGERSVGGGSVSMACKTLARLCHGPPLDDGYMQVTPPAVHSVIPICKIGNDGTGDKLISLLEDCGSLCRNVDTKYVKTARRSDPSARTALAVLPIFQDGRRGCFFDAASNTTFSAHEMVDMLNSLTWSHRPNLDTSQMSVDDIENYRERLEEIVPDYGAFFFGYPHLLPKMQGESLAQVLVEARSTMIEGGLVVMDLNGVPGINFKSSGSLRSVSDLKNDEVIGSALEHIDILHMNEDELVLLTGCSIKGTTESHLKDDYNIAAAMSLFLVCGVGVVAVTRGKRGSIVACNNQERFRRSQMLPSSWADCTAKGEAVELPHGTVINSNGAGDSFTAGLLVAAMLRHTGMTVPIRNGSISSPRHEESAINTSIDSRKDSPTNKTSPKKKLTPYTLYMRENYVTLKKECNDDKKAIFSMCHEMWEHESDEVKAMYERKVQEENEAEAEDEMSKRVMDDMETLDSTKDALLHNASGSPYNSKNEDNSVPPHNLYMTNRSLNLESAVLFASLVAAYHIDVNTRDCKHIDISILLERALVSPSGLEEI